MPNKTIKFRGFLTKFRKIHIFNRENPRSKKSNYIGFAHKYIITFGNLHIVHNKRANPFKIRPYV